MELRGSAAACLLEIVLKRLKGTRLESRRVERLLLLLRAADREALSCGRTTGREVGVALGRLTTELPAGVVRSRKASGPGLLGRIVSKARRGLLGVAAPKLRRPGPLLSPPCEDDGLSGGEPDAEPPSLPASPRPRPSLS